jgi:hypothetical protein
MVIRSLRVHNRGFGLVWFGAAQEKRDGDTDGKANEIEMTQYS